MKEYKPFPEVNNIYLLNEEEKQFIYFKLNNKELKLEIKKDKYIPKSGLLFKEIINKEIEDKTVLDLGCGYLGILSIFAFCYNAKKIDAIDIDIEAIKWFNKLIKENKMNQIHCFKSNYFSKIKEKYDRILSNPPQMPMIRGNIHDSGGKNGRKYIKKVIKESYKHLNINGKLYILLFDFLGVEKRTNNKSTIIEYGYKVGYKKIEVISKNKKYIQKGGITYNNIDYIQKIYPKYQWKHDNKGLYCHLLIVCLER